MFVFMSVIFFILELLAIPVSRYVITPLADRLSSVLDSRSPKLKRLFSGVWQLPKSVCMVLIFSLLLNFYTSFINNPTAGEYINDSSAYQAVQKNMLNPILNANLVKRIPVLVGEAFRKAAEDFTPANADKSGDPNYWKLPAIKYFNGMTIDEAVISNSEIDDMAKKIVGDEEDDREKARLLYEWVSKKIRYDKVKAAIVLENPSRVNSGSIITFEERTGVCFDYSCLYVSMCRAAGLKVRLVSGLGYSGETWGEHVWNQVYYPKEDRWINVDTTFGNSGYDYFDNPDFSSNHKYDVVQAEW
jgi:transglutaminase-like putative cysteine protease